MLSADFAAEALLPNATNDGTPRSLSPIDFDGDGDLDVLTARAGSQWYENVGGAFAPRQLTFDAGTGPKIGGGDLDSDGDVDALIAYSSSIYGYFNNGDMTFTRRSLVAASSGMTPVSMADVDGDGDVDLVGGTNSLAWYENDGSETFTARALTGSVGSPATLASVDVDADGDLDFLASGTSGLGWFENDGAQVFTMRSIGAGSFGTATPHDVDGDGDLDVVSTNNRELRWYENDGNEAFTVRVAMTAASGSTFYADAADVDADGDVDLLSTADGKVTWHENDGAENFTTRTLSNAEGAVLIATMDVDGDGALDIVSASTTGNKYAWRRQLIDADFGDAPAPYSTTYAERGAFHVATGPMLGATRGAEGDGVHGENDADDDGVALSVLQVGATATATVQVTGTPAGARLSAWIDFNGDGSWGGDGEQIAADWAVVEGQNILQFSVPAGAKPGATFARFRLSTAGGLGPLSGTPDGEVEDYAVQIAPANLATGVFALQPTISTLAGSNSFPVDVDQDGDIDVVGGTRWFENNGSGAFTTRTLLVSGSPPHSASIFHASDLDGDGDLDLMGSGDRIYWYENNGANQFVFHATNIVARVSPIVADIDGDGALDVAQVDNGIVYWYRNDGHMNFAVRTVTPAFSPPGAASVAAIDLDSDGDLDFVARLAGTSAGFTWFENQDGLFVSRSVALPSSGGSFSAAGDLDGDGDVDLVLNSATPSGTGSILLAINDGTQNFSSRELATGIVEADRPGFRLADVNGDGNLDIVAPLQQSSRNPTLTLAWFDNQGGMSFAQRTIASISQRVDTFVADLDSDGDLDALIEQNGTLLWLANQSIIDADYGDAPGPYPTLRRENGAAHGAGGPTLGALHSADGDGAHSPLADGDASDDGVTFGTLRVGQANAKLTVDVRNAPAGAKIDAWIDFNGDGNWNQADEQILAKAAVIEGMNVLQFAVPAGAASGVTFARVRLSTAGGLSCKGAAIDGEVEDYAVTIAPPAATGTAYGAFQIGWGSTEIIRPIDMDGDGDVDTLTAQGFLNNLGWGQNVGNGGFLSQPITGSTTPAGTLTGLAAGDFDRDGDLDVAFATSQQMGWYENNGGESFRLRTITIDANVLNPDARSLEIVDIDGDGDLDLLTARVGVNTAGAIVALINDGKAAFTARVLVASTGGSPAPAAAKSADLDGDGDLDIAAVFDGVADGVRWYKNDRNANFSQMTTPPIRSNFVVATDIEGDGDVDLAAGLIFSADPSTLSWLENDGQGVFTVRTIGAAGAFGAGRVARDRVAAGDVDGDGDTDVVVADLTRVWLFRNDGSETFAREMLIDDATAAFTGASIADLNGDGDLEILAANVNRGTGWFEAVSGDPPFVATNAANYPTSSSPGNVIDGADFLQWQRGLGQAANLPPGLWVDWDRNGEVGGGDLQLWTKEFGQGVVIDYAWVINPPTSEATAETALAAATAAALDEVYAAGDFTLLFTGEEGGGWKPKRRRI